MNNEIEVGVRKNRRVKMEDKIEINEYVRFNNGEIGKVIDIKENPFRVVYSEYGEIGLCSEIVKHSKQLIDLIEVGDYVNGREVKHIAMFEGFPDYPKLIFVDETHLMPDDTCENEDIKTILTKEIYMANCYKVGGENE